MRILTILLGFTIFLSTSCTKKETKNSMEAKISNLESLATSQYTLTMVIGKKESRLVSDKMALITMTAVVKYGIDFSKIKVLDLDEDKEWITLKLPPAKEYSLDIDPEKTYTVAKNESVWRNYSQTYIHDLEVEGEQEIRKKIKELSITKEAEDNAKDYLRIWLQSLGFKSVNFQEINEDVNEETNKG